MFAGINLRRKDVHFEYMLKLPLFLHIACKAKFTKNIPKIILCIIKITTLVGQKLFQSILVFLPFSSPWTCPFSPSPFSFYPWLSYFPHSVFTSLISFSIPLSFLFPKGSSLPLRVLFQTENCHLQIGT